MKIIDKYILKKLIPMCVFFMFIIIVIVSLFDYFFNDNVAGSNLNFKQILFYYTVYSVFFIKINLPMVVFLSTIFTVLKLSSRCEIVAFLATGTSYQRFLKPFTIFSLLLLKLLLVCEGWLFPIATELRYNFEKKYFGRSFFYGSSENKHIKIADDKFLFIDEYNKRNFTGYNIYIDEIKDNKLLSRFSAQRMHWDKEEQKWIFYGCKKKTYNDIEELLEDFDSYSFDYIKLVPNDLVNNKHIEKTLTIVEINKLIKKLKASGVNYKKFQIEQFSRLQRPFLILFLIIMAVLFSSKRSRMGNSLQLIAGFVLAGIIIFGSMFLEGFAVYGNMNIFVTNIPLLFCIILDMFLYKKVQK